MFLFCCVLYPLCVRALSCLYSYSYYYTCVSGVFLILFLFVSILFFLECWLVAKMLMQLWTIALMDYSRIISVPFQIETIHSITPIGKFPALLGTPCWQHRS